MQWYSAVRPRFAKQKISFSRPERVGTDGSRYFCWARDGYFAALWRNPPDSKVLKIQQNMNNNWKDKTPAEMEFESAVAKPLRTIEIEVEFRPKPKQPLMPRIWRHLLPWCCLVLCSIVSYFIVSRF